MWHIFVGCCQVTACQLFVSSCPHYTADACQVFWRQNIEYFLEIVNLIFFVYIKSCTKRNFLFYFEVGWCINQLLEKVCTWQFDLKKCDHYFFIGISSWKCALWLKFWNKNTCIFKFIEYILEELCPRYLQYTFHTASSHSVVNVKTNQ